MIFPIGSFGHTGFTGTTLWMDPGSDTYFVLLANAIHPRGNAPISNLRGEVATAVAQALQLLPHCRDYREAQAGLNHKPSRQTSHRHRRPRIRLTSPNSPPSPRNTTTRSASASSPTSPASTRTAAAPSTSSPPTSQRPSPARNSPPSSRPSTASSARRTPNSPSAPRPTPPPASMSPPSTARTTPTSAPHHDQLKDLDAVVIDLQDAGVALLHLRGRHRLLPRSRRARTERVPPHAQHRRARPPQPHRRHRRARPRLRPRPRELHRLHASFPSRHGMTLGELARFLQRHGKPHRRSAHRRRHAALDARPSSTTRPAFPGSTPAPTCTTSPRPFCYPALTLLEATNTTVGRGTPTRRSNSSAPAFHQGQDHRRAATRMVPRSDVAAALTARHIPGVTFAATTIHRRRRSNPSRTTARPSKPSASPSPIATRSTARARRRNPQRVCISSTPNSSTSTARRDFVANAATHRRHHTRRRPALHRRDLAARARRLQDRARTVSALQITIASQESHPRSPGPHRPAPTSTRPATRAASPDHTDP